jgi:hypothetical protein
MQLVPLRHGALMWSLGKVFMTPEVGMHKLNAADP